MEEQQRRKVVEALRAVVAELDGFEARPGQEEMATAVAGAFDRHEHLLVQAGTGTGKSLAYLVPAVLTGGRVVIVTATRALQEQLCRKDLPFLAQHTAPLGHTFTFTQLKGRSNYACRARLADLETEMQESFTGLRSERETVQSVARWAAEADTGDRADLDEVVSESVWSMVSMDSYECPGRQKCAHGDTCFAEAARDRAAESDVVVVNTALYGQHLVGAGRVLPPHSYVVIDEAHTLEEIASTAFGVTMGPTRIGRAATQIRTFLTGDDNEDPVARLDERAQRLGRLLEQCPNEERIDLDGTGVRDALAAVNEAFATVKGTVDRIDLADQSADTGQRKQRVLRLIDSTREDLAYAVRATSTEDAAWVDRRNPTTPPVLHVARVDVGDPLRLSLFARRTAVLSSATLATGGDFSHLAWRLGLRDGDASTENRGDRPESGPTAEPEPAREPVVDADTGEIRPPEPTSYRALDVGSPFDYRNQAILYCAAHLPDPRSPKYADAWIAEAVELARAAGGRTLGLCTSLAAARALREALTKALAGVRVLSPDDLPRAKLMEEFARDETSCLVGSLGLWQGIDVAGPSVSLVVIDKIPFQRPDDPLALARRDRAESLGHDPFATYDLPRAALLLAQGSGRLVRTSTDRGVVAVLDPRIVTKRYGRTLVESLPPMFRMTNPE
ncbi:MAG TPA: ATP-dependent DNA helicase, partial [Acidimicrobiia bacterium]